MTVEHSLAYKTAVQSITTTPAPLVYGAELVDTINAFNVATSTSRHVVQAAYTGRYGRFGFSSQVANTAYEGKTFKNGAAFRGMAQKHSSIVTGNAAINAKSAPVVLATSDYFEAYVDVTTGTNDTAVNDQNWGELEIMPPWFAGALVDKSAGQALAASTVTTLTFDQEVYDIGGWHDNVTNNSRLTIPSGVSLVRVQFNALSTTTSGQIIGLIGKNGAGTISPSGNTEQLFAKGMNGYTGPLAVTAGDYFVFQVFVTTAQTLPAGNTCWFSIEQLPPLLKYALVTKNATQALSAGVAAIVTWNTEVADVGTWHDTVTNNTRLTVPSGVTKVRVSANVEGASAANPFHAQILKNGAVVVGTSKSNNNASGADYLNLSTAILDVVAGDYFEVEVTSTTARNIATSTNGNCWFAIEEVKQTDVIITPNSGTTAGGTALTITGALFTGATGVTIDGNACTSFTVVDDENITCTTPSGSAGAKDVVIQRPSFNITIDDGFTYTTPAPTPTSVSPNSGTVAGGTSVTITGTNFTGVTDVKFDGNSATSIVVVNSTTITCDTPAGSAGAVDVDVIHPTNGTGTLVNGYTYVVPVPNPTSISPTSGNVLGGTAVTITGTNFTGVTSVEFDGTPATSVVVVNSTTITCTTPANSAGPADVDVIHPTYGTGTLAAGFTYTADPQVRVTQTPILTLDASEQEVRVTQVPILVLYQELQPNRVTQVPINVLYNPKPVPLPGPVVPEVPVTETWGWKTTLSSAINSQEQRSRLRETPRYTLQFSVLIFNELDRIQIYNMLMRYLKTPFLYPMYHYNVKVDQASIIGGTKIFCDTTKTDVRAGENIAVYDPFLDTTTYLECLSVDPDGFDLVDPLTFDVGLQCQVCPVLTFRILSGASLNMRNIDGDFSVTMESIEPRIFQRPGAAPTLTTIDGILIVPEKNLTNDDVPEVFVHGAEWFDNETSVPEILNEWSNPLIGSTRRYNFDRRTTVDYWRAICDSMKGRQGIALFPTFHDDIPLKDPMVLNSLTFTTENINLYLWYLETNYRYLAIKTANGMKYRRINGVEPHYNLNGDPDYLTVTLASSTGNTAGDNVISSISYMNLCRLDSDDVKLIHYEVDTEIELSIRAVNK